MFEGETCVHKFGFKCINISNVGQNSPPSHHAAQLQPQAGLGAAPGEGSDAKTCTEQCGTSQHILYMCAYNNIYKFRYMWNIAKTRIDQYIILLIPKMPISWPAKLQAS